MVLFQKFLLPSDVAKTEELGKQKVNTPALTPSPGVNVILDALNRTAFLQDSNKYRN